MATKIQKSQIFMFLTLFGFGVCMRFLPHLLNVTPIMAIALLSGFHFRNRWIATLAPIAAMFCSDLIIGLHSLLLFIYAPIVVMVYLGHWMRIRNPEKAWPVVQSLSLSVIGSVLFFVLSNLGVFFLSGMYAQSLRGFAECFSLAVPFFERSLMGDLMFTGLVFAAYSFVRQTYPKTFGPKIFGSKELSRGR